MKIRHLRLEDIPLYFFHQAIDPVRNEISFRRKPLTVGGRVYRTGGAGMRCDGRSSWDLHGSALLLTVTAGADDESEGTAALFKVIDLKSGEPVGEVYRLETGKAPRRMVFDLTGVEKIRIEWSVESGSKGFMSVDLLEFDFSYSKKAPSAWFPHQAVETGNVVWTFPEEPEKGKPFKQHGVMMRRPAGLPELELMELYRTAPGRYPNPELYNLSYNLHVISRGGAYTAAELFFDSMETNQISQGVSETVIHLADNVLKLRVEQHIIAFRECDVFKCFTVIRNEGEGEITLLARDAVNVAFAPCTKPFLTTFRGAQYFEHMEPEELPLAHGTTLNSHASLSHNGQEIFPGCCISFGAPAKEESGEVFGAALGWDGNWQYKIDYAANDHIFFSAGALAEPAALDPGEECTTPFVIFSMSDKGKGQLSRNFHDYFRYWGGLCNGTSERPLILNSWEGLVFDFDSAKLKKLIANTADLGLEMFVLDDGWFGNGEFARDNSHGLGDWQVDRAKFPDGLESCISECRKKGLRFGLWVEPEMVNTLSNLYNEHPEWVIAMEGRELRGGRGRTQLMLDLSRPEVEEFVYSTVAGLLRKYPEIAYIKWDHNCRGANQGSTCAESEKKGLSDRHNRAFVRIMERLRREFPEVMFQCCASGGGRGDVGTMHYFDEFWCSDNSQGHHRIPIQYGSSHFFPALAQASHVSRLSEFPSEYKFRCDVAMTGRMGVELDPAAITTEEAAVIRKGVAAYKEIRPVIHQGDLYRGRAPQSSDVTELTFVSKEGDQAVLFGFKRYGEERTEKIKASGLKKRSVYKLKEINPDLRPRIVESSLTGAELMKGIEVDFGTGSSSVVIKLELE